MPVPAVERLAFVLVTGAEDKGFEPLRGCPQHAFQVCTALFAGGRQRLDVALCFVRGHGRTAPDVGE